MAETIPDIDPDGPERRPRALLQLAREYGVLTSYRDVHGRIRQVRAEGLQHVLRELGASLHRIGDAPAALRERRQAHWSCVLEPVVLHWVGGRSPVLLRIPREHASGNVSVHLALEAGETRHWAAALQDLPVVETAEIERVRYEVRGLALPEDLPPGYHGLSIDLGGRNWESLVLAAPLRAYAGADDGGRLWGVFLPLYALRSRRSWGAGDLSDLEQLQAWTARMGGQVVGTLPLLAAYLDEPHEPSPYSPASRLFWNELYVDPADTPELGRCAAARDLIANLEGGELAQLRAAPLVDYRRVMALKRSVLEKLADCCFSGPPERQDALRQYVRSRPEVEAYARFRAVGVRQQRPWTAWPSKLRGGGLDGDAVDEKELQYQLYAQWTAHEQVEALASRFRQQGPGLYLDLPLGIHREAFDVWRWPHLFLSGMSGGAPPDSVFVQGQNWSFPPMHPERIRDDGYRYVREYLGHSMRRAGILRIDHVMGLHRLYCIPGGMAASDGAYVSYAADELYAILCIESHRNRCMVTGENLGTVPPGVNRAMARHGIQQMYVVQYELDSRRRTVLPRPHQDALASMNTHDMPTFAAYLGMHDVDDRRDLGLLDEAGVRTEQENRRRTRELLARFLARRKLLAGPATDEALLRACLAFLATSPAKVLLVNLEDLWQEVLPQNVPTAHASRPNWRRKARYALEEMQSMHGLAALLQEIDRLRKEVRSGPTGQRRSTGAGKSPGQRG